MRTHVLVKVATLLSPALRVSYNTPDTVATQLSSALRVSHSLAIKRLFWSIKNYILKQNTSQF